MEDYEKHPDAEVLLEGFPTSEAVIAADVIEVIECTDFGIALAQFAGGRYTLSTYDPINGWQHIHTDLGV